MRVTQAQIASRLGISQVAVSHALRGTSQASPHTQRRVRNLAQRLGYRLNTSARATRTGRFGSIGFLRSMVSYRSWYPESLLEGIEDFLEARGLRLVMGRLTDQELADDQQLPHALREWSVDGLIVNYISSFPTWLEQQFQHLRVAAVWVNVRKETDCVHPDDVHAGRTMCEHLLDLGHQRIAFLNMGVLPDGSHSHYSSADRQAGYEQSLARAGHEPVIWSPAGQMNRRQRFGLILEWMRSADRPSAVICASDRELEQVLHAADALGVCVPDELSVIGVATSDLLHSHYGATTLTVPEREMGAVAVEMLLEKIDQPDRVLVARTLAGTLDHGRTTAPPAQP